MTILLSEANHPPHFTAISETKINKDTGLNFVPNIPGYSFAHSDTQYAAGGFAIYTKDNISYVVCHDLSDILTEAESVWLEVILNGKKTVISVIYIGIQPPNMTPSPKSWKTLCTILMITK